MRVDRKRKAFARLAAKLASQRMKTWSMRPAKKNPSLEAGLEAARSRESDVEEERLRSLEIGTPPDPAEGLDVDRPWWAMALTTDPNFLRPDELGQCEMLMGLACAGGPAPDWQAIQRSAAEIFDRRAKQAGLLVDLHFSPGSGQGGERALDTLCGGRALRSMPAFGINDFDEWSGARIDRRFDRRRANRRRGLTPPVFWEDRFGSRAQALWEAGYSERQHKDSAFDDWPEAIASLRDAMLAHGAKRAERCPGFFSAHPEALSGSEPMERIDSGKADRLRAAWSLGEIQARPGSERARSL